MPRGNGGVLGPANIPTTSVAKGVWSLMEQQLAQRQGIWPIVLSGDPYFDYTTLLLPGNGTNGAQNNTFLDGSTNNFTITRNGNTTQGTFSPFSQTGWGNYFSGGANYLSVAATTSIDLASSDFTIECWAYPGTQTNAVDAVFGYGNFTTMLYRNGTTWSWEVGNGSSSNYFTITATVAPNTWQHIALTRSGNTFTFWKNGSSAGTNSTANAVGTASKSLRIGDTGGGTENFTGYISNFRITKGRAVYTSAFTPPTTPLTRTTGGTNPPQGTECSLLTCQSNRFLDSNGVNTPASSPLTITPNGSPTVVAFSPFNPSASWSAATYGGSGYFDGSGDYLSAPASGLNGSWTIEFWWYPTVGGAVSQSFFTATDNSNSVKINAWSSNNQLIIDNGVTGQSSFTNVNFTLNQWNHIAFVRNGATTSGYINGVLAGSNSFVPGSGITQCRIASNINVFYTTGNISNFRVVDSVAVYTGAFTPPTAPLTNAGSTSAASYPSTTNVNTSFASSATSLLLNFTNAGIYDATSKLVLETVNSASLSNAIAPKWGSTSIKFASSTSDYLWSNNQPAQVEVIGTSDFTIEGWVYLSTINTAFGIISRGTSTTGWSVNITSGNKLQFSYTASSLVGATSLVQNTWYYFAVVRSGSASGNLKLYLSTGGAISSADATSAGAVTDNFNQTNAIYVGADRVGTSLLNGYLQDIRLTNYARTITAAPTAAFPTL